MDAKIIWQAMNAIEDANDCVSKDQFDTALKLLREASKLIGDNESKNKTGSE